MSGKTDSYEKNFSILEEITESLNRDEIGIDDLMEKTKIALDAAKKCINILNSQKGEFKKLEAEFNEILKNSSENENDISEKDGFVSSDNGEGSVPS